MELDPLLLAGRDAVLPARTRRVEEHVKVGIGQVHAREKGADQI
jgi:hypothetical protein